VKSFEGDRDMSMMKVARTRDRTIVVDSVSKRFSANREHGIGCLVSHHEGVMEGVLHTAVARLVALHCGTARALVPRLKVIPPHSRTHLPRIEGVAM